ncbi:MAG: hypothetical protein REI95_04930 [Oxalicibacterium faecigallinarum]|nr:hypothetical protein [Oxalicibacterium faecigallinarum]MDQ7968968.1 hypothetical protein [Oxalicibacterium faecigallinarum]
MKKILLMAVLASAMTNVFASSDAAWEALYARTEKACLKKSNLNDPQVVGERIVFGKHILYRVEGIYPQAHMQGKKGSVYCLHPYPKGRPEIADVP